jgi:hypothetical protein
MSDTHGFIYVLTNQYMPCLVKIGMTTQSVKKRMSNLYGTGVPVQFECVFAFRVPVEDVRKVEDFIHSAYADKRVNPHREFFKIDDLDQLLKWLHKVCDAFHLQEEVTDEVNTELNNVSFADKAYEEEVALEKKSRAKNFTFSGLGIAPGTTLYYKGDQSITCVVHDDRRVRYNGEVLSLSNVSRQLLGYHVQPTPHWLLEDGTLLFDLYENL